MFTFFVVALKACWSCEWRYTITIHRNFTRCVLVSVPIGGYLSTISSS
jgi:hypothetical protein